MFWRSSLSFGLLLCSTLLAGCGVLQAQSGEQPAAAGPENTTSTPAADGPPVALVNWATATPQPSAAPQPSNTPQPSATPTAEKTATAEPTPAPSKTALDIDAMLDQAATQEAEQAGSTPPTATPEPLLEPEPTIAPPVQPTAPPAESSANPADPVRVRIGAINMNLPLVSVGLDANRVPIVPNHDAAWYNLSARPGQGDNVVLWGHVLRFTYAPDIPAPFARVKELGVGAPITVQTADGSTHRSEVTEQVQALPGEISYILPQGSERLTLVSCIGEEIIVDGALELSHRLITIAEPVDR
jgi:sortase (surface protein transpeptidase)